MDVNIIKDERSERYKRYTRNKFEAWKERARKHLPEFVIAFYKAEQAGKYIPYERHVLLGQVVEALSNPFLTIQDVNGHRMDSQSEMVVEIITNIQVAELFAYVKKISTI